MPSLRPLWLDKLEVSPKRSQRKYPDISRDGLDLCAEVGRCTINAANLESNSGYSEYHYKRHKVFKLKPSSPLEFLTSLFLYIFYSGLKIGIINQTDCHGY